LFASLLPAKVAVSSSGVCCRPGAEDEEEDREGNKEEEKTT
jgi:hypothetical protein